MIYVLIVTTIEPLRGENRSDYSEKHLMRYADIDYITYVFLSHERAEKELKTIINAREDQSRSRQVFNVKIEEYKEGIAVSHTQPDHIWLYNRQGELVEKLDNVSNNLISQKNTYSAGDVVEILHDDVTFGLGIIVRPLGESVYYIVTGPEYDDTMTSHSVNLRRYDGSPEKTKFMKKLWTIYNNRYRRP